VTEEDEIGPTLWTEKYLGWFINVHQKIVWVQQVQEKVICGCHVRPLSSHGDTISNINNDILCSAGTHQVMAVSQSFVH